MICTRRYCKNETTGVRKNCDPCLEKRREYRRKYADQIRAKMRIFRQKNRHKVRNYQAKYRSKNPQELHHREVLREYGLKPAQYQAMLIDQGGCCAICTRPVHRFQRRLAVDHCHETGNVRGLLCARCNRGLGLFGDNLEGIMRAVRYLEPYLVAPQKKEAV